MRDSLFLDDIDERRDPSQDEHAQRRVLLWVMGLTMLAALLQGSLHAWQGRGPNAGLDFFMAGFTALIFGLLKRRRIRLARRVGVVALFVLPALELWLSGSARSFTAFILLSGVVFAGVFYSRRVQLGMALWTVGVLAGVNWAQAHGLIAPPGGHAVGLGDWMTVTAVFVGVAAMTWFSHSQAQLRVHRHRQALAQRALTEQQRDRALNRFARLFTLYPVPVLVQNMSTGEIVDTNTAFERECGYVRSQLLGRTDAFLWADPGRRATLIRTLRAARRMDWQPIRFRHADGRTLTIMVTSEICAASQDQLVTTLMCLPQWLQPDWLSDDAAPC